MQTNFKRRASGAWQRFAVKFAPILKQFMQQFIELFRVKPQPDTIAKSIFLFVGVILSPITLAGVLFGYKRGYDKFMKPKWILPRFHNLPPIMYVSMIAGGVLVWVALFLSIKFALMFFGIDLQDAKLYLLVFLINFVLSLVVFRVFRKWHVSVFNLIKQMNKHGSAHEADYDDLKEYTSGNGHYVGTGLTFSDKGHLFMAAGARSGKSKNFLISHLMGLGGYIGSTVVIDPKGEAAAIVWEYLEKTGKRVVMLNPWHVLEDHKRPLKASDSYNPLDILSDKASVHLTDDCAVVAEMCVPVKPNDDNEFFTASARNFITSILLYIAVTQPAEKRNFKTLWTFCRRSGEEFDNMLADMATSEDPVYGETLRNAASEIVGQMEAPETFGSILAQVFESTNFLKSVALQDNLVSNFDPYSLADGNTVVFVIIPPDKLKSHSNWLRLVVTTMMRSLVRKPSETNRTTFICDEAAQLGVLSELETAMAVYAGYNISLWLVYQDLNQVHGLYGDKWQSIIANASVQHYFGVRDNFTASYVSEAAGTETHVLYKSDWMGNITESEANHRPLFTPDEVKRISGTKAFTFFSGKPVAVVPMQPYYEIPALKYPDGKSMYAPNPYIENSK